MAAAIVAAIAAIVGAGVTIWQTSENNKNLAAAGQESKSLALMQNQQQQAQFGQNMQLQRQGIGEKAREFDVSSGLQKRQLTDEELKNIADQFVERAKTSKIFAQQAVQNWAA